jgi:surface protein
MFYQCTNFNQDISSWNVSSVTNMNSMFRACPNFNQDISTWCVSSVINMILMFNGCSVFNQDLSPWPVFQIGTLPSGFAGGAVAWVLPQPNWGSPNIPC